MPNIESNYNEDHSEGQRLGTYLDPIYQELYSDKFSIKRLSNKDSQKKALMYYLLDSKTME